MTATTTTTTAPPPLTLSTSSTTSTRSTSSQKYNLSPTSTTPILVYRLRSPHTTLTTERDLCQTLDKDPSPWRCSRKHIPRGCSRLDVYVRDLFNEPERTRYRNYPNQDSNLASVGLPRGVFWKRLVWGRGCFGELYILSPEGSPPEQESGEGSKKVSRGESGDDCGCDGSGDGGSPTERTLRGAARKLSRGRGDAGDY